MGKSVKILRIVSPLHLDGIPAAAELFIDPGEADGSGSAAHFVHTLAGGAVLTGAAALVGDGRIVAGCNVENASYGVGLCAECALVGDLHMSGGGQLVAFVCVNGQGETIMPCGRCRQLLNEFALPGMLLETVSGIRTIDEVLPDAFGPRTLQAYVETH